MDVEPMQKPSPEIVQAAPVAFEFFHFEGETIKLTLFPDRFAIEGRRGTKTHSINIDTKFDIFPSQPQTYTLQILTGEAVLRFQRSTAIRWTPQEWQRNLMLVMTRVRFLDHFHPIKKIGLGISAEVYTAESKRDHTKVAVKIFSKKEFATDQKKKQSIWNQILLMRKIKSTNVVKVEGVYNGNSSMYLVQEYARGRTLSCILCNMKPISLEHRRNIIRGLMKALAALQKEGIIHRDVKPANIVYNGSEESLKLLDFGLATEINLRQYLYLRCGSAGHVAPEILFLNPSEHFTFQCVSDVFSAGTIYYNLLFGKPLFAGQTDDQILESNQKFDLQNAVTPEMLSSVIPQEFDFLSQMLQLYAQKRIKASQALLHPFLVKKQPNRSNNGLGFKVKCPQQDQQQKVIGKTRCDTTHKTKKQGFNTTNTMAILTEE